MTKYILSIDQGTTSSRAIIFDQSAQVISQAQEEFNQIFPQHAWVEHQPDDIWHSVLRTSQQAIEHAGISPSDIAAIGITNQRETTIIWDRKTGQPIYNAIVWQDRRTSRYCQNLIQQEHEPFVSAATGLLLDPYFCASKINWLLDNVAGARAKAERGELAFGTVDCFLLWRLTNGNVHRTDATNASRTLLFNIHHQQWDDKLLELFDIPASLLPEVMDSADNFGVSAKEFLGASIPILGIAGDQQAALFGQACFKAGMAKSTYGTGCFLILNTGKAPLVSKNKLLTTVAYRLKGQTTYAIEGSIFMAGATMGWLRDGLGIIDDVKESESIANSIPVDHGVFLVPAFTGLGAPYWDPDARGAILGLTRGTGYKEIVSAGLQSVCYQTKDLQIAMKNDGLNLTTLRVDGAMAANNWLMEFLSDMLNAKIERPLNLETTALGVAYLAGFQLGMFESLDEITSLWQSQQSFEPTMAAPKREALYQQWQDAVARVRS